MGGLRILILDEKGNVVKKFSLTEDSFLSFKQQSPELIQDLELFDREYSDFIQIQMKDQEIVLLQPKTHLNLLYEKVLSQDVHLFCKDFTRSFEEMTI